MRFFYDFLKKMPHQSEKPKNIFMATIKYISEKDNGFPLKNRVFLRHYLQNIDDKNEVLFLLRINGFNNPKCRFINFIFMH